MTTTRRRLPTMISDFCTSRKWTRQAMPGIRSTRFESWRFWMRRLDGSSVDSSDRRRRRRKRRSESRDSRTSVVHIFASLVLFLSSFPLLFVSFFPFPSLPSFLPPPSVLPPLALQFVLVVTGDHSTPVTVGDHTCDPVPFLVTTLSRLPSFPHHLSKDRRPEENAIEAGQQRTMTMTMQERKSLGFGETACSRGVLGRFPGKEVMPFLLRIATAANTGGER